MLQSSSVIPLYHFQVFGPFDNLVHFVSGRAGGVSEGELGSLNLSFRVGENPEHVRENRRRLSEALGIEPAQLLFPAQTHSDHVRLVEADTQPAQLEDTDALITREPGRCICVMSADCVPILLYDPVAKAVGAVHAGWRGTVSRILTHTVEAMQQHFGCDPRNIRAGIGPSICQEVYQVGSEVIEAVQQAFGTTQGLIERIDREGRGYLNLWEANRLQLRQLGVSEAAIETAGICTYQHSDEFFSARRSSRSGRFAAGIMLRS